MNSPKPASRKAINKRVAWGQCDEELLKKVKKATADILARTENLRRITIKAMGNETGELALLEQKLSKLPKTRAFIDSVKETDAEYRIRRVQNSIKRMKENGELIQLWRVVRESGIKRKFFVEVQTIFEKTNKHVP